MFVLSLQRRSFSTRPKSPLGGSVARHDVSVKLSDRSQYRPTNRIVRSSSIVVKSLPWCPATWYTQNWALRVPCPSRPCLTYRKVFRPVHFYFNVSENSSTFKFSTRVKYFYIKPFSFDHDHIRTQRYFFQRCSSGLWRRVDS